MKWFIAEERFTWDQAIEYCRKLGSGWRLPTRAELVAAYDVRECENLAPELHWSGTEYLINKDCAWAVHFGDGDVVANFKTQCYRVAAIKSV